MWVYTWQGTHVEVRGQLKGGCSLRLCGAWWQASFPPELSLQAWSLCSKNTSRLLPRLMMSGLMTTQTEFQIHNNLPMWSFLS